MSGATEAGETEAFARLLRELKDRSGLSYGALAKRLHMSTSTLHRYCNGTAVPIEYAPVERLARACRATPQELVELHRRWILADAARGRRTDQVAATGSTQEAGPAGSDGSADVPEAVGPGTEGGEKGTAVVVGVPGEPAPPHRPRRFRRRIALIASVAAVAALGAVVYDLRPTAVGDTTMPTITGTGEAGDTGDTGKPSAAPSPSGSGSGHKPSASAPDSPTGTAGSEGAGSGRSKDEGKQGVPQHTGAVPLTVGTRPYVYDNPCSQHFLVDSEPAQVGPPANEQDAPRWAAAYGAVSSGEQRVALTVQGTGEDTVVLEALHVRVLAKGAPLAWNDYSMGVGCGGRVETKSFDTDLDNGSPTVTVKNGQRAFPYKVSESDPEVFYVTAHTQAHDVRWDLTLDWSSGARHGTVRIDDNGTPFRTSADADRPGYDYPLGGGEWIKRGG
ncbi:DNA-binding protein [Streptomyces cellostaticus]|uniref:DNA-binding protein n=1 Tax=Streptomyces cellostaticus TaxID=67285 RepID=A0A101N8H5_9ACTN|nr:helix-turn-helix transcriptional regulator [Streptomyces cellostaticus]KUM88498.1 DNA-binding protein [Streptomyces cellostaticus]GHI06203.1 transcriptional regulator [Streptomyces cellostaticus]